MKKYILFKYIMKKMKFIKIIVIFLVYKIILTIFKNYNKKNKIILFYSMKCPKSMKFLLTWNKYLQKDDLNKETYECSNNYKICKEYNINKYPTVLMFYKNKNIIIMVVII